MHFSLEQQIKETPYQSYLYSYPHKTAYRPFQTPIELKQHWNLEDKSALFLYIHIPFCTMRCGFCNLFTLAQPRGDMTERYVKQLIEQMRVTADMLGHSYQFNSFACGGGTPTFLDVKQLESIFTAAHDLLGLDLFKISGAIEGSPDTYTPDRLALLSQIGIERISMGLQSFYHKEVQALVRKQSWQEVDAAINRIRQANIPILNLDLIYGIPGQTVQTFLDTLEATLRYAPEELYLYPLYVRPLTGLKTINNRAKEKNIIAVVEEHQQAQDLRLEMYSAARDYLTANGYEQVSMRMFKQKNLASTRTPDVNYRCQHDGMVGIGCGARSYTRELHYCEEYGVARARISDILHSYNARDPKDFYTARYGIQINTDEQQRRFIIQSLLTFPGLSLVDYQGRFNTLPFEDQPQLAELLQLGLATQQNDFLTLTDKGMGYADTIGPWLISEAVEKRMQGFELS